MTSQPGPEDARRGLRNYSGSRQESHFCPDPKGKQWLNGDKNPTFQWQGGERVEEGKARRKLALLPLRAGLETRGMELDSDIRVPSQVKGLQLEWQKITLGCQFLIFFKSCIMMMRSW